MKTNPDAGAHGCSFFLVPDEDEGLQRLEEAQEDRQPLERHRRAPFEDMRVPKRYLLGEENMGFMYLMQNFQTERLIACDERVRRAAASCSSEAIAYGRERKAFGKPIIKREYWQHKFVDLYDEARGGARRSRTRRVEAYNDEQAT